MGPFIPFLLALLVIALVLRVDLFFALTWFMIGLYGLSRLWVRRNTLHLQVRRELADHAFTDDEITVQLIIRNTGLLPIPWLEISESVPFELRSVSLPDQVLSLGPHQERRLSYTLNCRRRGYYQLGPFRAETGDILGIEQRSLTLSPAEHLTVYPRIVPLERLGLLTRSALVTLSTRSPLFEDPSRIIGVRDYQPGDPLRRIHWTDTARTQRLTVKQYQPAIARETMICLDLDLNDYPGRRYDPTEQAIVVAASLVHHMVVREGLPVGLATEAVDPLVNSVRRFTLAPHTGQAQLMHILEVLARVKVTRGTRFADLIQQESVHLSWGSTIVAIVGDIDDGLSATLLNLRRRGHAVEVIVVQQETQLRAERQAEVAGIPIHRIARDQDLVALA